MYTAHSTEKGENKLKTIILPGYSIKNKDWAEKTSVELKLDHEIIVHNWKHWGDGGTMSVKKEMGRISEELADEKFNILGKSVGARITVRVMSEMQDKVYKVILCGVASISDDSKKAYSKALSGFPSENIICFQNTKDRFVPYSDVEKFIHNINPKIKVIEKSRSDHHYPFYEDFQKFLK